MFSQMTSMFLVALCRATPSHVRRARGAGRRARVSKVVDKWGSGEDEVSVAPGASMRGQRARECTHGDVRPHRCGPHTRHAPNASL